jgi:hypothetical protein
MRIVLAIATKSSRPIHKVEGKPELLAKMFLLVSPHKGSIHINQKANLCEVRPRLDPGNPLRIPASCELHPLVSAADVFSKCVDESANFAAGEWLGLGRPRAHWSYARPRSDVIVW